MMQGLGHAWSRSARIRFDPRSPIYGSRRRGTRGDLVSGRGHVAGGELPRDQVGVEAAALEQRVMGADGDHPSGLEDDDPIGIAYGGEPVHVPRPDPR